MDEGTFKHVDAASYDEHAEAYAQAISRLAAPLAEEIVRLARLSPGERVLDVACGTGISTLAAAAAVAPTGSVVGVDLSEGMLEAARNRLGDAPGGELVELRRMDAEALDLPSGSFDAVISLCGVLHFPDVDRATAEMRRVLASGGRLVVSFGSARPHSLSALAARAPRRAAGLVLARAGRRLRAPGHLLRLVAREVEAPLEPILTTWAREGRPLPRLVEAVRRAGFHDIRASWHGSEVRFGAAEELWDAQAAVVTEIRKRLSGADAKTVERVRTRFLADADRVLERGGRLVYPYGATFVTAAAPVGAGSPRARSAGPARRARAS